MGALLVILLESRASWRVPPRSHSSRDVAQLRQETAWNTSSFEANGLAYRAQGLIPKSLLCRGDPPQTVWAHMRARRRRDAIAD